MIHYPQKGNVLKTVTIGKCGSCKHCFFKKCRIYEKTVDRYGDGCDDYEQRKTGR